MNLKEKRVVKENQKPENKRCIFSFKTDEQIIISDEDFQQAE